MQFQRYKNLTHTKNKSILQIMRINAEKNRQIMYFFQPTQVISIVLYKNETKQERKPANQQAEYGQGIYKTQLDICIHYKRLM